MELSDISVNEWEMIAFFESDPISREYGTDWYDSDSLYEIEYESGLKLSFAIHPIHLDVRLCLSMNGIQFYDWQAVGVKDVCYIERSNKTFLKIEINDIDYLEFVVKPALEINNSTGSLNT